MTVRFWLLLTAWVTKTLSPHTIGEEFPRSGNVHDSLGEAYLKAGQKDLAIASYRRSLALNPSNQNARDVLKKLEAPAP